MAIMDYSDASEHQDASRKVEQMLHSLIWQCSSIWRQIRILVQNLLFNLVKAVNGINTLDIHRTCSVWTQQLAAHHSERLCWRIMDIVLRFHWCLYQGFLLGQLNLIRQISIAYFTDFLIIHRHTITFMVATFPFN